MAQERKRRKRECTITLHKGKLLLSAAAGEGLPTQCAIYESGAVMALAGDPGGPLHLIRNSVNSTRRDISCQSLYSYLLDKYGLTDGGKLTAWYQDDGLLLFGMPRGREDLEVDKFYRVTIPIEQFENCSVFPDHGVLAVSRAGAKALGDRVGVYERNGIFCLAGDPDGALEAVPGRHSKRSIASQELVDELRRRFNGFPGALPARVCDGRVYFSAELPPKNMDFNGFRPLAVQMSRPYVAVTVMRSGVLRISAQACRELAERVLVYERGDVMALASANGGEGFVLWRRPESQGRTLTSAGLLRRMEELFGARPVGRLETVAADGAVYFSARPIHGEKLTLKDFRPSPVNLTARRRVAGVQPESKRARPVQTERRPQARTVWQSGTTEFWRSEVSGR